MHRERFRAEGKAKEKNKKRRLAKMEKQRDVLERYDCDRWLATTTEVERQAQELRVEFLGDYDVVSRKRGYGVPKRGPLHSSMAIDLTVPEFVDMSDVVDLTG